MKNFLEKYLIFKKSPSELVKIHQNMFLKISLILLFNQYFFMSLLPDKNYFNKGLNWDDTLILFSALFFNLYYTKNTIIFLKEKKYKLCLINLSWHLISFSIFYEWNFLGLKNIIM